MTGTASSYLTALLLPPALYITTAFVFQFLSKRFGKRSGYLIGFLFYWNVWCLAVPFLFMSHQEIRTLFAFRESLFHNSEWINLTCLLLPLIFGYIYAFPKALKTATPRIIIASLILAFVNAALEEFFWRGLFLKLLGSDPFLYLAVSSTGFAIWHFIPLRIISGKNPGGPVVFVAFAFILGLLYGIVTLNTQSILLVTVDHFLFDFSGLGGGRFISDQETRRN